MKKTDLAVQVFDKSADLYQEKYMNVDLYADTIDIFCQELIKNSIQKNTKTIEVLELACGVGNITKYILDNYPNFDILGTDLSENMLKLAAKNNPKATFKNMDCRDIDFLYQEGKRYDGLLFGFGLPYISKEDAFKIIQDTSKILNKKGVFYLSTMEDEYSKSDFVTSSSGEFTLYMYYHEAAYLIEELEKNNFEILKIKRQPIFQGTIKTDKQDLILIAQKK